MTILLKQLSYFDHTWVNNKVAPTEQKRNFMKKYTVVGQQNNISWNSLSKLWWWVKQLKKNIWGDLQNLNLLAGFKIAHP